MSVITGKRYWIANHAPGNNAQATITRSAPGAGYRLICKGLVVGVCAGATAPTAALTSFALINGASGGTSYLFGPMPIGVPNVAGAPSGYVVTQLNIEADVNTAMTLEFAAALGNFSSEAVWMYGITVPAA